MFNFFNWLLGWAEQRLEGRRISRPLTWWIDNGDTSLLSILEIILTFVSFIIGIPNVAGRAVSTVREPSSWKTEKWKIVHLILLFLVLIVFTHLIVLVPGILWFLFHFVLFLQVHFLFHLHYNFWRGGQLWYPWQSVLFPGEVSPPQDHSGSPPQDHSRLSSFLPNCHQSRFQSRSHTHHCLGRTCILKRKLDLLVKILCLECLDLYLLSEPFLLRGAVLAVLR